MIRFRLLILLSILLFTGCGVEKAKEEQSGEGKTLPESKTEEVFSFTGNSLLPTTGKSKDDSEEEKEPGDGKASESVVKVLNTVDEIQKAVPVNFTPVSYKDTVQISVNAANVRKGPHINYPVIATLSKNTKLEVYEKADIEGSTWFYVKTGNIDGWISASVVERYKHAAKPTSAYKVETIKKDLEIIVDVGNVRSGPGKNYPVITKLKAYSRVVSTEKAVVNEETWYRVEFSGKSGWVSETIVREYTQIRKSS